MTLRVGLLTCELAPTHGWAQVSLRLAEALRQAGVDLTLIAARSTPLIASWNIIPCLPEVSPLESRFPLQLIRSARQASAALRGCDVIHATVEPYAPLAAWIAGKRPLFVTAHGSYVRLGHTERWPFNHLYQRALQQATLLCVSHYTERVARASIPGARTVVINNGVDAERFIRLEPHPRLAALDSPAPIDWSGGQGGEVVLSVGAVKGRKGTLELVKAMAVVRQQRPAAQCVIIGSLMAEPGYVEQVRAAIREHGLTEGVHLLGHVPEAELLGWYQRASLFALPSLNDGWKFEGYGLVYLEASAAGLPVIGTRDCGAEDAIDDGVTGLLVSQSRVAEELPAAILRLLADPDLARRMGAAGRTKARQQTWAHVGQQVVTAYERGLTGQD